MLIDVDLVYQKSFISNIYRSSRSLPSSELLYASLLNSFSGLRFGSRSISLISFLSGAGGASGPSNSSLNSSEAGSDDWLSK